MSKLLHRQMEPFQSCQPQTLSLATRPRLISLTVSQAGKKPTLPGWRLGRCALQWLQGQCTIVIDVSHVGQSKPLHLRRRRQLKAMEVSQCGGGSLWRQAAQGAARGSPSPGHQASLWRRGRPSSSWEVNPLVRIRFSEGNQGQTQPARQQTGSRGWDQARTPAGRDGDWCPTVSLGLTI